MAFYIPDGSDTFQGLQAALEVYAPFPALELGGRLQIVGLIGDESEGQVSVSPFLRGKLGPVRLQFAPYILLDEPFGLFGDDPKVIGIDFAVSFVF